jgi:FMN reductase
MSSVIVLSGSPSARSRTAALCDHIALRLQAAGHTVRAVRVRDLPAEALLTADAANPAIAEVLAAIDAADGLVAASPVYKAAYSGVLKTLLDLLPQHALAGKVVLPVVTGGTPVHLLAIDYALRPVLTSLGAHHVVRGCFVLDRHITLQAEPDGGAIGLDPDSAEQLHAAVDVFADALGTRRELVEV